MSFWIVAALAYLVLSISFVVIKRQRGLYPGLYAMFSSIAYVVIGCDLLDPEASHPASILVGALSVSMALIAVLGTIAFERAIVLTIAAFTSGCLNFLALLALIGDGRANGVPIVATGYFANINAQAIQTITTTTLIASAILLVVLSIYYVAKPRPKPRKSQRIKKPRYDYDTTAAFEQIGIPERTELRKSSGPPTTTPATTRTSTPPSDLLFRPDGTFDGAQELFKPRPSQDPDSQWSEHELPSTQELFAIFDAAVEAGTIGRVPVPA